MKLLAQMGPLPHPDIPPPPVVNEVSLTYLAGLILAFMLAVGLILWLIFKPKAATHTATERPVKQAIKALKLLRNDVGKLSVSQISAEVSQVLRRYYQDRYSIPALARTSQELFPQQQTQHEGRQRKQWRERFNSLAAIYDWLEFSGEPASQMEAMALIDNAITRLEEERLQHDEVD
jgi:hypothetical protein